MTVEFRTNYWYLYPRREDLTLKSVEGLKDGVGIKVTLEPQVRGFSHLVYAFDDGPPKESRDRKIKILFRETPAREPQHSTLKVKAVLRDGSETRTYTMVVGYYPSAIYAARGRTSPSWVIIQESDLHLHQGRVEDWITEDPTHEERSYARKRWGRLIADASSDYEAAKSLAKAIIDDLEPYRGIPSDEMSGLTPFQQYERTIAGKDRVWCGNIAAIFSYACNALGIPCRRIGMNRPWPPEGGIDEDAGYRILLAEGHSTTEVFSESLNQWVWMDPTFRILGAYLDNLGPINMVELYLHLNEPNRAERLRLLEYDSHLKEEQLVPLNESKNKSPLTKYFKRDQVFRYSKKSSGPTV